MTAAATSPATPWSTQYQQAVDAWNAQGLNGQLQARGAWQDGDGNWHTGSGDSTQTLGGEGGQSPSDLASWGAQDQRSWLESHGIFPLSGADANAWADMNSPQAKAQIDKVGGLNKWLSVISHGAGGTIVNDPKWGQVFVSNSGTVDPYRDFVGNTNSGWLTGAINNFADSGGFVKMFESAILGPAISDIFGAALPTPSLSPADTLGLQQMATDAGLAGNAASDFVASGGTVGSTTAAAAADAAIPAGNVDEFGNPIDTAGAVPATPADVAAQTASATPSLTDTLSKMVTDAFTPEKVATQAVKTGINAITNDIATPSSTPSSSAASNTAAAVTTAAPSLDTLSNVGVDPTGSALTRLDGSNVYTAAGDLSIPGRGIISNALPV